VRPGATREEILDAYRLRAQVCHPDRHAAASPAVREAATHLMAVLNEARRALLEETAPDAATTQDIPPVHPLRIRPGHIVISDVVPGDVVSATVTIHSPAPQSGNPELHAALAGLNAEVLRSDGRTAGVRIVFDTRLLAEHRLYELEVVLRWGSAEGILTLAVTTGELAPWTEPGPPPRPAWRVRLGLLGRTTLAGLGLPVLLTAWAEGRLPSMYRTTPPYAPVALGLAVLAVTAFGAALLASRGFGRRPQGVPGAAAAVLLGIGTAAWWVVRSLATLLAVLLGRRRRSKARPEVRIR
jgi:hypothetical protein